MKTKNYLFATVLLGMFLFPRITNGQSNTGDVYWHIDPTVKTCSMVIDPSLTQSQWSKFTRQVSEIVTFKSLASAQSIGKQHFSIALEYGITPVDQHDPAWINTFTHPDADCPLGDQVKLPMFRAKYGICDKLDVGALWTKAAQANYGMAGAEVKYTFLSESEKAPAAAARASFIALTGVKDYDITIASVDLLASKKISVVQPYIGLKESLGTGVETTSKVNLDNENLLLTQGFVGISYSVWFINLAAEYNISDVNTLSFLIGLQSFKSK